jgi:hypothetical protein
MDKLYLYFCNTSLNIKFNMNTKTRKLIEEHVQRNMSPM